MINTSSLMNTLASQRKAYHSEADFQHALAWELHKQFPNSSVRLERPLKANGKLLHLDCLIQLQDKAIAVELKYKTRKLVIDAEDDSITLADHGAQDIGRYDFIKDIERLESITTNLEGCDGIAILLTNDSAYWNPRSRATVDEAFNLTEGATLNGSLAWGDGASAGTKKNRERDLQLAGTYKLNWNDFSLVDQEKYGQFRYLAVHVPAKTTKRSRTD
jgi:hypothetical protein